MIPSVITDEEQPQDQLELLLAELGRIETQQEKLRDAVKHNKQIVIHPRQEVSLGLGKYCKREGSMRNS